MNQTSNSRLVFKAQIRGPAETIFDLLADMPNYGRWLPESQAFGATTEVTPYPVRRGTTYLDAGPDGERRGSVTEFDRPKHLGFRHTMLVRKGFVTASLEVSIRYTLEPTEQGISILRELDLTFDTPRLMWLVKPVLTFAFRTENERILAELKRYVEAQSK